MFILNKLVFLRRQDVYILQEFFLYVITKALHSFFFWFIHILFFLQWFKSTTPSAPPAVSIQIYVPVYRFPVPLCLLLLGKSYIRNYYHLSFQDCRVLLLSTARFCTCTISIITEVAQTCWTCLHEQLSIQLDNHGNETIKSSISFPSIYSFFQSNIRAQKIIVYNFPFIEWLL